MVIKTLLEKPGVWICVFLHLPNVHLLKLFFKFVFQKSYRPRHHVNVLFMGSLQILSRVAVPWFTNSENKAGRKLKLILIFNNSFLISLWCNRPLLEQLNALFYWCSWFTTFLLSGSHLVLLTLCWLEYNLSKMDNLWGSKLNQPLLAILSSLRVSIPWLT